MIPLGGAGEIGKNMYVIEMDGRMVVIDCGVTFPRAEQLGVDLILPDFEYVEDRADILDGVIVTHGHEDHIGALPYLVRAVGETRIHGARFTLGLVRAKLDEHGLLSQVELVEAAPGSRAQVGPFEAEFISLTHSIPDCMAVALHTPLGAVVHTGDFRIDPQPVAGAPRTDLAGLARLGEAGVHLLLADSTNADESTPVAPESSVGEALARVMARASGRVLVTTFSSHIHRVQQVLDAAYQDGRVATLVGRSLNRNANIARNLGLLNPPQGTLLRPNELAHHRLDEQVVVCTGSQGEPLAALSRMARGDHPQIDIEEGDTVVYSSSTVPGNEIAVSDTINRLARRRATVITERTEPAIHASGHGTAGDLVFMLELLRPSYFAPIHGEARHQLAHAALAEDVGVEPDNIFILENGDVLDTGDGWGRRGGHVTAGLTFVDRLGANDVGEEVLRDRRHLAEDGLVLVVATVGADDGTLQFEAEVITRGLAAADDDLVADTRAAVAASIAESSEQRVTEIGVLHHRVHDAVSAMLRARTGQSPMVLPVIVEV